MKNQVKRGTLTQPGISLETIASENRSILSFLHRGNYSDIPQVPHRFRKYLGINKVLYPRLVCVLST